MTSVTIPPPIMGINTEDPVSEMDPLYALEMLNFFPTNGAVELRKGTERFSTVAPGYWLANFRYGAYDKLLWIRDSSSGVYDISSGGAGTSIGPTLASGVKFRYQCQFRDRMFFAAGDNVADVYHWTGTGSLTLSAFTGPGADDKALGPMCSYKNRLYFAYQIGLGAAYANLNQIWYGGVDAVTGALTSFDLTSVLQLGGQIFHIGRVTRAKDVNEDELFCIITSQGEVLLYQGDYPGSTTWAIVGRYFIPRPLSPRSFKSYGSTLYVATVQGVYTLASIMGGTFSAPGSGLLEGNISQKVKQYFSDYASSTYFNPLTEVYGMGFSSSENMLLIGGIGPNQNSTVVMNLTTGAWTNFEWGATGVGAARDFIEYQGSLYILGQRVHKYTGYVDEDFNGAAISRSIKLRPAYNYFDNRSQVKQFTSARPIVYQSEGLSLTMDADVDFANTTATNTETDTTDTAYKLYTPTIGLTGLGRCASIRIDGTVTTKRMSLQAIEVTYNEGGTT